MGISPGEKKIDFQQTIICDNCGHYGRIEISYTYTAFSLFFIPLIRWNKQYLAKTTCCQGSFILSEELAKQVIHGQISELDQTLFQYSTDNNEYKECTTCHYTTNEDFHFCPKCGEKL